MKVGRYTLDFSKTLIMGVLNVTPDSFSDGGLYIDVEKAVSRAKEMVAQGADIIDIGGESSRPGSDPVSAEEELGRVLPVIEKLVQEVEIPISIDSYKPEVVEKCLEAGVHIVNDIEGLRNESMIEVVAKHDVPVIVMHMLGKPKTMQQEIIYDDIIGDIKIFFRDRLTVAREKSINNIILDPGIGFGKTVEHNLEIIKKFDEFKELDCPLLIGTSRKSFIGKITGAKVEERLPGTIVSSTVAIQNGANIVRVHDIPEMKQVIKILEAI